MIAERSRETVPHHLLHIFLLSSPEEARILKQRPRGGNCAVTHLTHLEGHPSVMTTRLMQPDVCLACCTHAREIQHIS
ncbi:hypothetical protein KSD_77270 [Ktedonobacter sp. SOSP1-85]|nr:hypothetical protein KSD_77270 [Ktedonobacter sp. SOSP1-85]